MTGSEGSRERLELLVRLVRSELRSGCRNRAAVGGFDVFATLLVKDLLATSPAGLAPALETARAELAPYSRLTPDARRAVLDRLLPAMTVKGATTAPAAREPAASTAVRRAEAPAPVLTRTPEAVPPGAPWQPRLGDSRPGERDAPASSGPGLDDPVAYLKGVGPRRAELFERLGIRTVRDLVWHLPFRYEDRSNPRPLADLEKGHWQAFRARVVEKRRTGGFRRSRVTVVVEDPTGRIELVWFGAPYVSASLEKGREYHFFGRPSSYQGRLAVSNPDFEPVDDGEPGADARCVFLPVYPNTEGLHQKMLRRLIGDAATRYAEDHAEVLPPWLLERRGLVRRSVAILEVHRPPAAAAAQHARRRLAYEELLFMQLALALRRRRLTEEVEGVVIVDRERMLDRIQDALGFSFTNAQRRVVGEIREDLARTRPMARLLQGDVGSGKTAVALSALVACCSDGFQGALMAPTEILAEQHFLSIRPVCQRLGIEVRLVVGGQPRGERQASLDDLATGRAGIAVGTHALIEEGVAFARLGAVVVDEQHRFGVGQRDRLVTKGAQPNVLVMTATPIPRTLSLTLYGDLDVSVLDELPPGRQPIVTKWVTPSRIESVYRAIDREIDHGRQAFVVCPLVEESDEVPRTDAKTLHEKLSTGRFAGRRVGLLHGQLRSADKDATMQAFRAGELDVLVATTVVEVGVDVPNATVMVIVDADAYGLAQLHQLRGRIGRGRGASVCYLVAASRGPVVRSRLETMCRTQDGFEIAQRDLELRGPGEIFGTRQSGLTDLRVADLTRDLALLEEARVDVARLLGADRDLSHPENARLREIARAKDRALLVH